jgi:AraC-like DNA-binding protein
MDYEEHEVPASLRRHVQCIWRLRDAAASDRTQTIFPDGRCELIVHLGKPPRAWDLAQGWHEQARVLFAGQRRTPVRLAARGELDCVGVRLAPAASAAIGAASLAHLRDRIVDLHALEPDFAIALETAARRFAEDASGAELPCLLDARLTSYRIDERIESAVTRLESRDGQERIASLAAATGMSLRNFQVRFLQCVGLGAKELARVVRLQATLRSLDEDEASLAQLASEAGFSDQAHATREVAKLTGSTPARLRAALQGDRHGDDALRLAAAFVRGHT